jgi:hypothetical protein
MGKKIKKEEAPEEAEAQVIPEIVAVATAPFAMVVLTAIFRSVISFFTWRWLKCLFPKKKEKTDESSKS